MSALTKIEFERDTNCIEISLFAQCRALINEGMANEIDALLERTRRVRSSNASISFAIPSLIRARHLSLIHI